ncbi:YggT family protein [Candidatus Neomarinimicrobiota bacterium]
MVILLGSVLRLAVDLAQLTIIVHVVFSWVGYSPPLNQITRYYYILVESIYRPIRSIIPTYTAGLDFTPFVALLALMFVDRIFLVPFMQFGYRLAQ